MPTSSDETAYVLRVIQRKKDGSRECGDRPFVVQAISTYRRTRCGRRRRRDRRIRAAICHGVDGLAKIPEAPNIAGQNEAYLIEQLTAFKSGERKNEMMSVVVQDLSDADIENLAAYYSGIEISVGKTPGQ